MMYFLIALIFIALIFTAYKCYERWRNWQYCHARVLSHDYTSEQSERDQRNDTDSVIQMQVTFRDHLGREHEVPIKFGMQGGHTPPNEIHIWFRRDDPKAVSTHGVGAYVGGLIGLGVALVVTIVARNG